MKITTLHKVILVGDGYIIVDEKGTNKKISYDTANITCSVGDMIELSSETSTFTNNLNPVYDFTTTDTHDDSAESQEGDEFQEEQ